MPIVRVEPLGVDLPVGHGEAVAVAAWRLGYRWPTRCWGQAECMLCRVRVLAGEEHVEPPREEEAQALFRNLHVSVDRDNVRLGCRVCVMGDGVVVEKHGVVAPKR